MVTLPSPHALAEFAAGELEPRAVAEGVLGPQIRWLAGNGCAIVVLQETALFDGGIDVYPLSDALDALQSPLPVALQLPFGDSGDVLGELRGARRGGHRGRLIRDGPRSAAAPVPEDALGRCRGREELAGRGAGGFGGVRPPAAGRAGG